MAKTDRVSISGSQHAAGPYRYLLARRWGGLTEPSLVFVMLNPSTADDVNDDPTIRRCVSFAKRDGFGGIVVANLFAYRATDPDDLPGDSKIASGPENIGTHMRLARENRHVIFAWGASFLAHGQDRLIYDIYRREACRLWALGLTSRGAPRHPLYLPGIAQRVKYTLPDHRKRSK